MNGKVVGVVAADPFVRWAVSHLIAYQHSDFAFMNCDLPRGFCKRLLVDPSELVNRSFVWNIPNRPLSPGLRLYEEDFISLVLPVATELPCVLVITHHTTLPFRIGRLCTQKVAAKLCRGGVTWKLFDLNTGKVAQQTVRLVSPSPVVVVMG